VTIREQTSFGLYSGCNESQRIIDTLRGFIIVAELREDIK